MCERLYLSPRTVEAHVAHIFTKQGLAPTADDHRRVLAVLVYLRDHQPLRGARGLLQGSGV
jgi:DNA-binding NarL/FixJ family response regulator